MCTCEIKIERDGFFICTECGTCTVSLRTNEMTYQDSQSRVERIVYSRKDRFYRLLCNLRGWQLIKCDVMKKIDDEFKGTTVEDLKRYLIKNNKKIIGKLATIWRMLGNEIEPPSHMDFKAALFEFEQIENTKKSFILLLPYILEKIGRRDLCRFCKKPTQILQKKYNLYVNEESWDETRSLGRESGENGFGVKKGKIYVEQERKGCEQGSQFGIPEKYRKIEAVSISQG